MKIKYLFPNKYKKIGWIILVPTFIVGLISYIMGGFEPSVLNVNVPAIFTNEIFEERKVFEVIKNNIMDEIISVLLIISSTIVAFSKEKTEDEYISKIRLESLVWAVYVNYGILLLAILFLYGLTFFSVMVFNMFTVLIFFIIRFNWQLSKIKKMAKYEE